MEILDTKRVYDGKLVKLDVVQVRLPDGSVAVREVIAHPGAVAMVPLLENGDVVLVRQFRTAAGETLLEIPAGTLEPDEAPDVAATRELQEEIGYRPGKLEHLTTEYTAPGYTSERIIIYLATGLSESRLAVDDDEFIEHVTLPFDEALGRIASGEIQDGKTIIGLLLAARKLGH